MQKIVQYGKKKWLLCAVLVCFLVPFFAGAQANLTSSTNSTNSLASQEKSTLHLGLEAYERADWTSAVLFFRKVVLEEQNARDVASEALYWLMLSELALGDTRSAVADGNAFIAQYQDSMRIADVEYQTGRALYLLKDYDGAIKQLYAFVKKFPDNEKVSYALFWIAESLYECKNDERAKLFYTLIIDEYATSPKYEPSVYRLELIKQRAREEELLQLLRVTHEESVRTAEEYEKKCQSYEQAIRAYEETISSYEERIATLEEELALQ